MEVAVRMHMPHTDNVVICQQIAFIHRKTSRNAQELFANYFQYFRLTTYF